MKKKYFNVLLTGFFTDSFECPVRGFLIRKLLVYRFFGFVFMFFYPLIGWSNVQSVSDDCTEAPVIAGVSNLIDVSAIVVWNAVPDVASPTYTLEVYTDQGYMSSFGTYTSISENYRKIIGLTNNTTYYFRVKVDNTVCGDYGTGSFTTQLGYTPVSVTGFNQDVIANGIGLPLTSTTTSVDNSTSTSANFAYLSIDYKLNSESGASTFGLPVNRNVNGTGINYILQDYSENNSLRLPNQNDVGTLTLTDSLQLTSVYLAVAGGDGTSVISVEITFTDNTTQTVSNLSVTNWDDAATTDYPAIINNIGRVKRTTGAAFSGNFKLFQITIPIDVANQSKFVKSLKITKTETGTDSKIANIFAVSGKLLTPCPTIGSVDATATTGTSADFSWILESGGTATGALTYTLEVYKDAQYTVPVSGSPFSGLTSTSHNVTGLTIDSTYYYRVKATKGSCVSAPVDGIFEFAYCIPTSTYGTSYYISNFTTTGGLTNITNSTGSGSYNNYSNLYVSKFPGTSFNYSGTRNSSTARVAVYVDWNGDLDFDDEGETIANFANGAAAFSGTITIAAGTPVGDYRMRIRSTYYYNTTLTPCGFFTYGEAEDYTIRVITPPADCDTPQTPVLELSNVTASGLTGTVTATATAPSGYLLVRANAPSLTAQPVSGISYAVGDNLGGGTVLSVSSALSTFTEFLPANTRYYYFLYAYNEGGESCFGPIYGIPAVADATTCATGVTASFASNITGNSAFLNWTSAGTSGAPVTYSIEVYKDPDLTDLFGSYTSLVNNHPLTGLTINDTYYFRVKAQTSGCYDDTWSPAVSFVVKQGYTPINVTGFNGDVIANGTGSALLSTTTAVDGSGIENYAYMSIDYRPDASSTDLTYGLPVNRSLADPNISGLTYLLADYSGNNALRLPLQNDFDTLIFVEPSNFTDVYLAVSSGGGNSTISAEILFSDATSQEFTGLSVINWDGSATTASPAIVTNIGRVQRSTGTAATGNFKLFQIPLHIEDVNQTKSVTGIKITKTSTGTSIPNVFAVSGKLLTACPSMGSVSATATSVTSADFSWTLGSIGTTGETPTYTLEVYTDADYTTPVSGSPFTGLTADSLNVSGLVLDSTYYYRVKVSAGECSSDYVAGVFKLEYCVPTSTYGTSYYITDFITTNGFTNIMNSTGSGSYNNYSNLYVSKFAGTSFNYVGTRSSTLANVAVYVDWNGDLDFDDEGETVASFASGATAFSGSINIPAGTPTGNYRMRIRSTYSSYTLSPCGSIFYGEAEDYTISVLPAPADCETPQTPVSCVLSNVTASGLTCTVTPDVTAPSGYLLVRSTTPILAEQPVSGATYTVGADLGGGVVVSVSESPTTFTDFLAANTHYYYFLYAYNEGGASCFGPIYSTPATADTTTCAIATTVSAASNITNNSAYLNWTSVVGTGGDQATYTVEVYTDAALTNSFGSYTATTNSYPLTGLTKGEIYYYRVKAQTNGCYNDTWSSIVSFEAQQGYITPIRVSGFNADVIANGTGIAKYSTTHSVDAVDNAYVSLDYENTVGNASSVGLPINRSLTSATNTDLKFLFEDYSNNNSLRLPEQYQEGILTLEQAFNFSELYMAVTSGSGSSTISVQVLFSDGTSQTEVSFSLLDWYGTATVTQPALISNIGRANRGNNIGGVETGNSKIFYVTIPIDESNKTKLVSSVKITKTSTGLADPVPNIFALSGKTIDVCPKLIEANVIPDAIEAEITWTYDDTKATAQYYNLEVCTDTEFTTHVTGSPFSLVTTGTVVGGLSPVTTYYYRISGVNEDCTSEFIMGSFTTTCFEPIANSQTFCNGSTVADIEVQLETGAIANWSLTDGGAILESSVLLTTGTYYVSQTYNGCTSVAIPVEIIVNVVPAPVIEDQTLCEGTTAADLVINDLTLVWYKTPTGDILPNNAVFTTDLYYVRQIVDGCTSVDFATVMITVNSIAAPTANDQSFCIDGNVVTVSDIEVMVAPGAYATWYTTIGGDSLYANTELSTRTYYVTQSFAGGCTSVPVQIEVTVTEKPDAPTGATTQTFITGNTVSDLIVSTISGAVLNWYIDGENGELTLIGNNSTLINQTTYYVSQSINGCESDVLPITVSKNSSIYNAENLKLVVVYPNPATDMITVKNNAAISRITVSNLLGQTVSDYNFSSETVHINLSNFSIGTYILHIYTVDGSDSKIKVIKK